MRTLIFVLGITILAGCSSSEASSVRGEPRECITYRSMMTAPMMPDAMERVRTECEESRR